MVLLKILKNKHKLRASKFRSLSRHTCFTKTPKLRIGFIVGKDFDPIPIGTHDRGYPERFKIKNNTGPNAGGWGGMFHIDVSLALKMERLYPDILKVDIIQGHEVSSARLKRNHVNINLYYDVVIAEYNHGQARAKAIKQLFQRPDCRMWPSFDYYDWVCTKKRYMKQCMAAGIPMIDTIFIDNGLESKSLLKKIKKKGWDKFFIKPAAYVCFGNGAFNSSVKDVLDDPSVLETFVNENKGKDAFLVQPYTLKPDGRVFDEIRNFFIDGKWAYSVYTDGTDDDAVYEQPEGKLKQACRALAETAYNEVLKVSKWMGKPLVPLMVRIDIGTLPDKSQPSGHRIFVNEIECEISTWLARYCPFNLCEVLARASAKKCVELLRGLLESGTKFPDARKVTKIIDRLGKQLGV